MRRHEFHSVRDTMYHNDRDTVPEMFTETRHAALWSPGHRSSVLCEAQ